jgi:FkbM family methyltransferase
MEQILQTVYVKTRQIIRAFIINRPVLDRYFGKILVNVDLIIRKAGILNSGLKKGYLNHNGFIIHYGQQDSDLASFIMTNNDYEPETRQAVENLLNDGDIFVDLGANIGFFTLLAARLVGPDGKVFAFEPTPSTRTYLTRNVFDNNYTDRVVIESFAISDKRGKAKFSITPLSICNSITIGESALGEQEIEIETISLDEYFSQKGIKKVDLIKMDIEGQELAAIRGMDKINALNPTIKIIFEYHQANITKNNLTGVEFFQVLQSYGFNQFTVLFREPFKIKIPEGLQMVENTAVRANLNILAEKI